MAKQTKKKTKKLVLLFTLGSCIVLAGACLGVIIKGITLDHIRFPPIYAKHVRIHFDHGIMVSIEQLDILGKKTAEPVANPERFIAYYNTWSHLFREVRINQIHHQGHTYTLLFKNGQFSISGNNFQLSSTLTYHPGQIQFKLSRVEIKPYPVTITGVATFVPANRSISFKGNFDGPAFSGLITASHRDNQIKAAISTEQFTDLAGLLTLFPLDQKLFSWISDNITARHYRIDHLELNAVLLDGKPVIRPESISGKAVATEAAVTFHPSLPPITSKQIRISYTDDKLAFNLDKPKYKSKDLSGSKVKIAPLLGTDTHLIVDIQTDTRLDTDIHEILNIYNIHIPLTQHTNTTQTNLLLDFALPGFILRSSGNFISTTGNWTYGGIGFQVDNATIQLENDLITIANATVDYQGKLHARMRGTVDTAAKQISLETDIKQLDIDKGRLDLNFSDPENLIFSGNVNTGILPLTLNDEPVTQYTFQGTRSTEKLTATINKDKISLIFSDALTIRFHDYLLIMDLEKLGNKTGSTHPFPISISGPKSLITADKLSIPFDKFRAELQGSDITFTADIEQGKILFESNNEGMSLTVTDTDTLIAQDFFKFADLEGGKFNLSLKGEDEKKFEGFVEFSNVALKNLALLNNVLSFLNTIPALATLSSPGFDADGYHVAEGIAHFSLSSNLLTIHQLRTNGITINSRAEGWIDFENDILNVKLELISLKDYSKIISKIPWAGYVILGEDGSISTSLLLTGNTNGPNIRANLPSKIIMLPFNMVKRTIKWPSHLFNKIKELDTEETGVEK